MAKVSPRSIRFSEQIDAALQDRASDLGVSVSEVIRDAVAAHLGFRRKAQAPAVGPEALVDETPGQAVLHSDASIDDKVEALFDSVRQEEWVRVERAEDPEVLLADVMTPAAEAPDLPKQPEWGEMKLTLKGRIDRCKCSPKPPMFGSRCSRCMLVR